MNRFKAYLIALCCVVSSLAQTDSVTALLPTDVYAYYVVVTPGETPAKMFGHAAIRMACPSAGLDYCFTIKTPEIKREAIDVLFGNKRIGLVPEKTKQFRANYVKDGRGITEYRLNLSIDELRMLWQQLDEFVARGLCLQLDYVNNNCTQVTFLNICNLLKHHESLNLDSIIRATIPVQTRREAILPHVDLNNWQMFIAHSVYGSSLDEKVSPQRLVVMPLDAARVLQRANVVASVDEVVKPVFQPHADWFTPLMASYLFLLLCLLPWKQVDYVVLPLQGLLLLLLIVLFLFARSAGIGWNWLIGAIFPPTAPIGIGYMLCHLDNTYCQAQVFFALAFFMRTVYFLLRHKQTININFLKHK